MNEINKDPFFGNGPDRRKGVEPIKSETTQLPIEEFSNSDVEDMQVVGQMQDLTIQILTTPGKLPVGYEGIISALGKKLTIMDKLIKSNEATRLMYHTDELMARYKLLVNASRTNNPETIQEAADIFLKSLAKAPN